MTLLFFSFFYFRPLILTNVGGDIAQMNKHQAVFLLFRYKVVYNQQECLLLSKHELLVRRATHR